MMLPGETCEEAVARLHRRVAVLAARGDVNELTSQLIAEQKRRVELEDQLWAAQQREAEYPTLAAWLKKRLGL